MTGNRKLSLTVCLIALLTFAGCNEKWCSTLDSAYKLATSEPVKGTLGTLVPAQAAPLFLALDLAHAGVEKVGCSKDDPASAQQVADAAALAVQVLELYRQVTTRSRSVHEVDLELESDVARELRKLEALQAEVHQATGARGRGLEIEGL